MNTNIIDKPRIAGAEDLLGVDKYMKALNRFITSAAMPTTIAIQGEWGSGKTSMMNQIMHNVCEAEDKPAEFYGVWLNTWQYSLMKSPEECIISIIEGLTEKVRNTIETKHKSKAEQVTKKIGSALSMVASVTAKTAFAKATGVSDKSVFDDFSSSSKDGAQTILALRSALEEAIADCIELDIKAGNSNRGFIFFIDDLDRIDPPVAVQILEIIKNIFEVDNCLFILAIDYNVVVKGLEPKFGKLTEKNEREFRSFFDKIIQLPFTMPLASYKVDDFLIRSLVNINYLDNSLVSDQEFKAAITEMAVDSLGTNPRSLKRLINTLSLIQIMNEIEEGNFGESKVEKMVNFGLVCLQIAYPLIYEIIQEDPNFPSWNENFAQKLRLKELTPDETHRLNATEEFDEEWEKIIFRFSQKEAYLKNRAFYISALLNKIKDAVPSSYDFASFIEGMLSLSSVTSVSVENNDRKANKSIRDYSKFIFRGKEYNKARLVLKLISTFVEENRPISYDELQKQIPQDLRGGSLPTYETHHEALTRLEATGYKRFYIKEKELVKCSDHDIAVCNGWSIDNVNNVIKHFKTLGFDIE